MRGRLGVVMVAWLLVFGVSCGQSEEDCVTEGNTFSGKAVVIKECCSGLTPKAPLSFVPKGERDPDLMFASEYKCREEAPPGVKMCIRCGDGICGEYENPCTCPSDCPEN